jgi:hypothetical protein
VLTKGSILPDHQSFNDAGYSEATLKFYYDNGMVTEVIELASQADLKAKQVKEILAGQ